MEGASKKLAVVFGKHFGAEEYDKFISFNGKVEKREKEIVAEMKQTRTYGGGILPHPRRLCRI